MDFRWQTAVTRLGQAHLVCTQWKIRVWKCQRSLTIPSTQTQHGAFSHLEQLERLTVFDIPKRPSSSTLPVIADFAKEIRKDLSNFHIPSIIQLAPHFTKLKYLKFSHEIHRTTFSTFRLAAFGSATTPGSLVNLKSLLLGCFVKGYVSQSNIELIPLVEGIVCTCPKLLHLTLPQNSTTPAQAISPVVDQAFAILAGLKNLQLLSIPEAGPNSNWAPLKEIKSLRKLGLAHLDTANFNTIRSKGLGFVQLFSTVGQAYFPDHGPSSAIPLLDTYHECQAELDVVSIHHLISKHLRSRFTSEEDLLQLLTHPAVVATMKKRHGKLKISGYFPIYLNKHPNPHIADLALGLYYSPFAGVSSAAQLPEYVQHYTRLLFQHEPKDGSAPEGSLLYVQNRVLDRFPDVIPVESIFAWSCKNLALDRIVSTWKACTSDQEKLALLNGSPNCLAQVLHHAYLDSAQIFDVISEAASLLEPAELTELFDTACGFRHRAFAVTIAQRKDDIRQKKLTPQCCAIFEMVESPAELQLFTSILPTRLTSTCAIPVRALSRRDLLSLFIQFGFVVSVDVARQSISAPDNVYEQILPLYEKSSSKIPALHLCVESGNLEVVNFMLAQGCNVNAVDHEGANCLFYLGSSPQAPTILSALLERKVNLEHRLPKTGDTPLLHLFRKFRCAPIVVALIESGADICAKNATGNTILTISPTDISALLCASHTVASKLASTPALLYDCTPTNQHLLLYFYAPKGVKSKSTDWQPLQSWQYALTWDLDLDLTYSDPNTNNFSVLGYLASHWDVNFAFELARYAEKRSKYSPKLLTIVCAALSALDPPTSFLLKLVISQAQKLPNGLEDAEFSLRGRTPLLEACAAGLEEPIRSLRKAGANLHAKDKDGNTALLLLARSIHEVNEREAVASLVAELSPADLNIRNSDGNEAIWYAQSKNDLNLVEILLAAGAQWKMIGPLKQSLLHCAIKHDDRLLRLVLKVLPREELQEVMELPDADGMTPLALCCNLGLTTCFRMLIDFGATAIQKNDPLPEATYLGLAGSFTLDATSLTLVKLLLDHGADPMLKDKHGRLAIELTTHADVRSLLAQVSGIDESSLPPLAPAKKSRRPKVAHHENRFDAAVLSAGEDAAIVVKSSDQKFVDRLNAEQESREQTLTPSTATNKPGFSFGSSPFPNITFPLAPTAQPSPATPTPTPAFQFNMPASIAGSQSSVPIAPAFQFGSTTLAAQPGTSPSAAPIFQFNVDPKSISFDASVPTIDKNQKFEPADPYKAFRRRE